MKPNEQLEARLRRLGHAAGDGPSVLEAVMRRVESMPVPARPEAKGKWIMRSTIGIGLAACVVLGVFLIAEPAGGINLPTDAQLAAAPLGAGRRHAVTFTPKIAAYEIDPHLRNVQGAGRLGFLTARQKALLAANGFLILPSGKMELYELYKPNPSPLVTTDCVFHAYHVLLSETLKNAERAYLVDELAALTSAARARMVELHQTVPAAVKPAAGDALTYWCVADRLMHADAALPKAVAARAAAELQRIGEATFIGKLPGETRKRDYTVYAPIAGYEADARLSAYFRANRFLTLETLGFETDRGVQRCVLAALAIYGSDRARAAYKNVERFSRFLSGPQEDVTPAAVLRVARQVFGGRLAPAALADAGKCAELRRALSALPRPTIADQPLETIGADPTVGWGMRTLAPGVSVRAMAYQQVGEHRAAVATGAHMAHVMGTDGAGMPRKDEPLMAGPIAALAQRALRFHEDLDVHTSGLVVLSRLSGERPAGWPQFMRTAAWQVKTANTQMAAWSEIEHDLFLYMKDNAVYCGEYETAEGFHGYVEPVPDYYAALASLVGRTRATFEKMGVFERIAPRKASRKKYVRPGRDHPQVYATPKHYRTLEELLLKLRDMSVKELENRPFDKPEIKLLEDLAKKLKYLAFNESNMFEAHEPMSCIVRIVREYLEAEGHYVGVGRPLKILAVVPYGGKLHWATGGVYAYYEFARPLRKPLTDGQWRRDTRLPLTLQRERPWLLGKGLGLEKATWTAAQFKAWLPKEPKRFGDSHGRLEAAAVFAGARARELLEANGFVTLDAEAADLAAEAFARGRYDDYARRGLYLLLRNTGGKRRRTAGVESLRRITAETRDSTSMATSLDYGVWAFLSLRLLEDFRDDAEVRQAVGAYAKGMERHLGKRWESFVKELLRAARAFPSGKG